MVDIGSAIKSSKEVSMLRIRNPRLELYREHLPMMGFLGEKFSKRTGVNVDDLVEEAQESLGILLCDGWGSYDAGKASPTTFIYMKTYWHLMSWCREQGREKVMPEVDEVVAKECWIQRMWSELGEEGRSLLRIIFEAPGALEDELWECRKRRGKMRVRLRRRGAETKGVILRYLRDEEWSEGYIKRAFSQIEEQVICE